MTSSSKRHGSAVSRRRLLWFTLRDISQFSYQHGAASLLDFLDAERSYRSTELSYRQALASYLIAQEQLREAVGTRDLQ